ncbi:hypothetical protein R1flu_003258 [Riccia fluitans]|uniref:Uncharacterized protein n=1 Tax=Riccia fluitans TaxID=41844 RepID=A0ABD1Y8H1_9MARC
MPLCPGGRKNRAFEITGTDKVEDGGEPKVIREAFGISREAAQDEERGATWPNVVFARWQEVEDQGVCQYFLVQCDRTEHMVHRPVVPKDPVIILYQHVNWAHMLTKGLASAIKEYVWRFSEGTVEAAVKVYWALALVQIIKHYRAQLFGSPLNCPEAVEAGASSKSQKCNSGGSETGPTLKETDSVYCPDTRGPTGNASDQGYSDYFRIRPIGFAPPPPLPPLEQEVEELSSSSLEQPPRKEPRVERLEPQTEGRQEDTPLPGFEPSDDELLIGTLRRDIPHLRQESQQEEVKEELGHPVGPGGRVGGPTADGTTRDRPLETVEEDRPDIGPRYTDEEVRRRHPELFVQPEAPPPTQAVPTVGGAAEPTLLEKTCWIS